MALPPPALTSAMILREEECSPVQKETGSPYIQHRCQIPVPDPRNYSQYIVSVRPKVEERLIKSSDNSEFAPSLLCCNFMESERDSQPSPSCYGPLI